MFTVYCYNIHCLTGGLIDGLTEGLTEGTKSVGYADVNKVSKKFLNLVYRIISRFNQRFSIYQMEKINSNFILENFIMLKSTFIFFWKLVPFRNSWTFQESFSFHLSLLSFHFLVVQDLVFSRCNGSFEATLRNWISIRL